MLWINIFTSRNLDVFARTMALGCSLIMQKGKFAFHVIIWTFLLCSPSLWRNLLLQSPLDFKKLRAVFPARLSLNSDIFFSKNSSWACKHGGQWDSVEILISLLHFLCLLVIFEKLDFQQHFSAPQVLWNYPQLFFKVVSWWQEYFPAKFLQGHLPWSFLQGHKCLKFLLLCPPGKGE